MTYGAIALPVAAMVNDSLFVSRSAESLAEIA